MTTSRKKVRAFKVFDKEIKCGDYQFVPGKLHKHEGKVIPCKSGFHACPILIDCFNYKLFHLSMRVFEVELSGVMVIEGNKIAAEKIKLLRELPFYEIDEIVNEGFRNLGYGNKGDDNKGDGNKGNSNEGNYNKGNYNKGRYNTGNYNKGNYNKGNYNKGNDNKGNDNKGNWNKGNWNKGDWNKGDNLDNT